MFHEVPKTGLDSSRPRPRLFRRAHEVAEVEPSNFNVSHPVSIANVLDCRRGARRRLTGYRAARR
jgi:hypothetical protein